LGLFFARQLAGDHAVCVSRLYRPCPLQSGHGVVLLALFMAIRRTPFIALSVVKAGDQRGNLPAQLNVDYGKADHGISAGLNCRSTD
jgi:hypothetical protein